MVFALFEHDPRIGLSAVRHLAAEKFGSSDMHWLDVTAVPGVQIGWVLNPDGSVTPYVPPLAVAQAERVKALRSDCHQTIIGGFTSSALGAPHRYESDHTDQTNIDRAALTAFTGGEGFSALIPCTDAASVETVRPHTGKQANAVAADLHTHVQAARTRYAELKATVAAATTVAAVEAVTWS